MATNNNVTSSAMPIDWKRPERFKPLPILKRIQSVRSIDSSGNVSFSGFVAQECVPTLLSMVSFPAAGEGLAKEPLVWKALGLVKEDLTPTNFLQALREAFREKLAVREQDYWLLTSMSLVPAGLPHKLKVLDCVVEFPSSGYPKRFIAPRDDVIAQHKVDTPLTPSHYCPVIVKTRAKSTSAAYSKAMQSADLVRAILCLMANSRIQVTFGTTSLHPVNSIRPGSRHTVHVSTGESAEDGLWFDPMFFAAKPHRFDNAEIVSKKLVAALRKIHSSSFRESLVSSLTRFVRALDHPDFSSAFLKLWSALETLTIGETSVDYDKLIRRVAFIFSEEDYHIQVLEHLREYRNKNVHQGEEAENSRLHCFQLQTYYAQVAWFYIRNATRFASLKEGLEFLDLPFDAEELRRRSRILQRASRFRSP